MRLSALFLLLLAPGLFAQEKKTGNGVLHLNLRTRVQPFKGSDVWDEVTVRKQFPARETAIILCDVWDKHWCHNASMRCEALAKKMEPLLATAREQGVLIIHAPSECMDFYKDTPQRKRILAAPRMEPPRPRTVIDAPLPIDDKEGGCDDEKPSKPYRAWTRQHPAITIGEEDVISDNGRDVYSFLQQRGIKNLLVMGVHTNMCILNRTFAIKQMTRWGVNGVLVRDLTDSMYDPRKAPFVSHEQGTELVVQHIEKYWCPSVLSSDLLHYYPPAD
jgi:nicotinamidase-related amidase